MFYHFLLNLFFVFIGFFIISFALIFNFSKYNKIKKVKQETINLIYDKKNKLIDGMQKKYNNSPNLYELINVIEKTIDDFEFLLQIQDSLENVYNLKNKMVFVLDYFERISLHDDNDDNNIKLNEIDLKQEIKELKK